MGEESEKPWGVHMDEPLHPRGRVGGPGLDRGPGANPWPEDFVWITAANDRVPMTAEQMLALAMSRHRRARRMIARNLSHRINAGATLQTATGALIHPLARHSGSAPGIVEKRLAFQIIPPTKPCLRILATGSRYAFLQWHSRQRRRAPRSSTRIPR